ncbi:Aldose 1-epimerase, partial [hydrothermal vent metagenome]
FQKMMMITFCFTGLLLFVGCRGEAKKRVSTGLSNIDKKNDSAQRTLDIQSEPFGETANGEEITQYLLSNSNGVSVGLINLGATVTSVYLPDNKGETKNVVLNWDDIAMYEKGASHFGSICGRYANRIAKGKFQLEGKEYQLAINNKPNHLHGGIKGFNRRLWMARKIQEEDVVGVEFNLVSSDGEEGYPGNLNVSVTYRLNKKNELKIEYIATTDKTTVLNLTNHCYWNLAGAASGTVLDQLLTLHCDEYLEFDETKIPTGKKMNVAGTEMDFLSPRAIGERISQVKGKGYDHCYVMKDPNPQNPVIAAKVEDPKSGRVMEIFTTEPGVQFYTPVGQINNSNKEKRYSKYAGFCLEAQHFPDSPNQPGFPSTVLRPGEVYRQVTIHRFSVK